MAGSWVGARASVALAVFVAVAAGVPMLLFAGQVWASGGPTMHCLYEADGPPPELLFEAHLEGPVDYLTGNARPLLGQLDCVFDEDGVEYWRTTVQVVPFAAWLVAVPVGTVAAVAVAIRRRRFSPRR